MAKGSKRVQVDPSDQLALECRAAGIPVVREVMFHPTRRWRLDFVLNVKGYDDEDLRMYARENMLSLDERIALEVDGGSQLIRYSHKQGRPVVVGRHERAEDYEKMNWAAFLGWRCYRATPSMIKKGTAISVLLREWEGAREVQERATRHGVVVQGSK